MPAFRQAAARATGSSSGKQEPRQEAADMRFPGDRTGNARHEPAGKAEEKVHDEPDEDEAKRARVHEDLGERLGRNVEGGRRAAAGERAAWREGKAGGRRHHAGYGARGSDHEPWSPICST